MMVQRSHDFPDVAGYTFLPHLPSLLIGDVLLWVPWETEDRSHGCEAAPTVHHLYISPELEPHLPTFLQVISLMVQPSGSLSC